ncbi:jacalin-like lectin [Mangrovicoccus ximenensis]|uniref:jacalin-like lectin n=1 Tax=Mangrovicoccus ximenensis TaxID=1911570 RepID=UPI000D34B33E|nr:hypothetical protein [Mangrovicoccus ximenensis]
MTPSSRFAAPPQPRHVLAALVLALGLPAQAEVIGNCTPRQAIFGGGGGSQFTAVAPSSIQLQHGKYVDAIILNGRQHGGTGGMRPMGMRLGPGEYINRVQVRSGKLVDRVFFTTSTGKTLGGGGMGGQVRELGNIRVLTIGGRAGKYLDQLEITYCANYLQ